jgi:hypothetical protein
MTLTYKSPCDLQSQELEGIQGLFAFHPPKIKAGVPAKSTGLGERDWEVTQTHHLSIIAHIAQGTCEVDKNRGEQQ